VGDSNLLGLLWQNPNAACRPSTWALSRKLRLLVGPDPQVDLISGVLTPATVTSGTRIFSNSAIGLGFSSTGANSVNSIQDLRLADSWTALIIATVNSNVKVQSAIEQSATDASVIGFNFDDQFNLLAGRFSCTLLDSGVNRSHAYVSSATDGKPHAFLMRKSGTSITAWIDGIKKTVTTSGGFTGNPGASTDTVKLVGDSGNAYWAWSDNSTFHGLAYFNAILDESECEQLSRIELAWDMLLDAPNYATWVAPSSSSVSITCSVGNANADGVTSLVSSSIPCAVGNANASGVTALVSRSIPCAVGNANATGITALINQSIPCAVGNSNATGVTATISAGGSVTITCSVANANSTGPSALISTTVQCSVANAAAAGVTAAIQSGIVITTATANALATGITAAINAAISASVGNANASGVTASVQGQGIASLLPDRRYTVIGAEPGYVIAAAGRNYQVTIQ
jgi:hypothetical protein